MTEYLTDGSRLYEVAARSTVRNYGLTGGWITSVVVRDCVTECVATIDELNLAALSDIHHRATADRA